MAVKQLPDVRFPWDLDGWDSLLRVCNRSESQLATTFGLLDDHLDILPRFDQPELWSVDGGFAWVEGGEVLWYGRGIQRYADNGTLTTTGGQSMPSGGQLVLSPAAAVNCLRQADVQHNVAAAWGSQDAYTAAGTLEIGGVMVDFAVSGDGPHGKGSIFNVSRPDLLLRAGCAIDADGGLLTLTTSILAFRVVAVQYRVPQMDDYGVLRRVCRLEGLIRGLNDSQPVVVAAGSWVRGNIAAAHHRLMVRAIQALEAVAGVDWSEDRSSLDFRLRDLGDLCVEPDDWDCATAYLDFAPIANPEDPCDVGNAYQFTTTISGDYDSFTLRFGDGTETDELVVDRKVYATDNRVEPSITVQNGQCIVTNGFYDYTQQAENVALTVAEIPCPDITVPEPTALPDFYVPNIVPFDFNLSLPSIWISIPDEISIPPFATMISVSVPEITFPEFSWPVIPPLTVVYTISVIQPETTGACFALVPCSAGHCHGL